MMRARSISTIAALSLGAVLLGLFGTVEALEPAKPSQLVTLQTLSEPCLPDLGTAVNYQSLPDGTTALFPAIPNGKVLVVTGISFIVSGGQQADLVKRVALFTVKLPVTINPAMLFLTAVELGTTAAGVEGGGSAVIPQAVVKPGALLCVFARSPNGVEANITAVVHGFLTKDD